MNRYQLRKARMLAAVILAAACNTPTDTPLWFLPTLVAAMGEREWVSVSLAAGVPVADEKARALVVALLGRLS